MAYAIPDKKPTSLTDLIDSQVLAEMLSPSMELPSGKITKTLPPPPVAKKKSNIVSFELGDVVGNTLKLDCGHNVKFNPKEPGIEEKLQSLTWECPTCNKPKPTGTWISTSPGKNWFHDEYFAKFGPHYANPYDTKWKPASTDKLEAGDYSCKIGQYQGKQVVIIRNPLNMTYTVVPVLVSEVVTDSVMFGYGSSSMHQVLEVVVKKALNNLKEKIFSAIN